MATSTIKRAPPPPPIAVNDPIFNRWLHDLTAFIAEGGGIDTGQLPGYDALVAQVNANTSNISANATNIAGNTAAIVAHTSQIATLTARNQVFNGTAAPVVGLGVDGDWYSKTTSPFHIYVKSSGAWITII